jgi:hypothetical protein
MLHANDIIRIKIHIRIFATSGKAPDTAMASKGKGVGFANFSTHCSLSFENGTFHNSTVASIWPWWQ